MQPKKTLINIKEKITGKKNRSLFFLESVQKVNRAIQESADLDKMMQDVLDLVLEILKCDRAWLAYPCDTNSSFWTIPMERTVPEWPGFGLEKGQEVPMNPGVIEIFGQLLNSKDPIVYGKETWETTIPESMKKYDAKSQIATAIYPKTGKPWAFGIHQCSNERTWSKQEVDIFKEIGYLITGALNKLLLVKKLSESEQSLTEKVAELERVNKLMVGRELEMIKLKKELERKLKNS